MEFDPVRVVAGLVAAGMVALAARRRRSLSADGAVAATIVGGTVVAGAGWWGGALLVLFFLTSTALSRLTRGGRGRKASRGSERDAVQVVANGGVASLAALAMLFAPPSVLPILVAALAGTLGAATADTWSTEIGSRFGGSPRSILTGRPVERGMSGGVTFAGTLASVAGSALIAVAAWFGGEGGWLGATVPFLPVLLAGVVGGLADSLLGASLQATYRCPACDSPTERTVHGCGTPTALVRGVRWVTNDVVNLLATLVGAAAAVALRAWLP